MKQTIIPRVIENKTSKAGKQYWQIEDNDRYIYSVFEEEIAQKLDVNRGKPCDVEVIDSADGRYKNIRKFYAAGPGAEARADWDKMATPVNKQGFKPATPKAEKIESKPSKDNEKTACVLVSYAKDMWVDGTYQLKVLNQFTEAIVEAYKLALEKL